MMHPSLYFLLIVCLLESSNAFCWTATPGGFEQHKKTRKSASALRIGHFCGLAAASIDDDTTADDATPSHNNAVNTYPPVALPFSAGLGFLWHSAQGRAHKYMERLRQKYGNAYIIWNKYVVIADPDAIKDVVETYNLPKTPEANIGYHSMFGGGILAAPWKSWQKQRRMVAPPFAAPAVRNIQLSGKIEACSQPFFQVIAQVADTTDSIEIWTLYGRYVGYYWFYYCQ